MKKQDKEIMTEIKTPRKVEKKRKNKQLR